MTDPAHHLSSSRAQPSPKVVVLMSTYNGERYVSEQLESILRQLPPGGTVIVRDDGSTDRTVASIAAIGDSRVAVVQGKNMGFGASFLTLLTMAPTDAELVMFSDQDDVWLPCKIGRAWQHLRPLADLPALYGSAQMLVDQDLRPLHATPPWPRGPSLEGALTENIITGCTAALNRPALLLLRQAGAPPEVRFHDWWMYLVVSAFGQVIHDDEPTLLYRQHGANHIGHGVGWWGRYRQIALFLLRHDWVGILLAQVEALMSYYGPGLTTDSRRLVLRHFRMTGGALVPRWRLIFSLRRWRQDAIKELAFRLLLLLHKLHIWPLPGRRIQTSCQPEREVLK